MRRTKMLVAGGAAVLLVAGAGAGVAAASDHGGDGSRPITGDALVRASRVALAQTGGGRVTDSEVGDEEGYYEVEVRRTDGSQVDVHLDRNFGVIDSTSDGNHGDGPDANGN